MMMELCSAWLIMAMAMAKFSLGCSQALHGGILPQRPSNCQQIRFPGALLFVPASELSILCHSGGRNFRNKASSTKKEVRCGLSSRRHASGAQGVSISGKNSTRKRSLTRAVAETTVEDIVEAKREIDRLLSKRKEDEGLASVSWALYADEETKKMLADAVTKLGASGQDFGLFLRSKDSHGVWEVFYAPHISRLSTAVSTKINPLQYKLSDSGITSNVRYLSPVGDGWLSAAGDFVVKDGKTVEVLFDSFWWDVGRDNLQPDPKGQGNMVRSLVNVAGKGAFIPSLSVYPVYYADSDVVIFEFTPLRTKIAARRIHSVQ